MTNEQETITQADPFREAAEKISPTVIFTTNIVQEMLQQGLVAHFDIALEKLEFPLEGADETPQKTFSTIAQQLGLKERELENVCTQFIMNGFLRAATGKISLVEALNLTKSAQKAGVNPEGIRRITALRKELLRRSQSSL